eukprot:COSAG06_NODE_20703_length_785_cov_0.657434_1_plen_73_part_10
MTVCGDLSAEFLVQPQSAASANDEATCLNKQDTGVAFNFFDWGKNTGFRPATEYSATEYSNAVYIGQAAGCIP